MPLTDVERADMMRRVLQDDHIQAIGRLRAAAHHWQRWPLSTARLAALIDAYVDLQLIQINRVTGSTGAVLAVLDERLFALEATVAQHTDRLRRLEDAAGLSREAR